MVFIWMSLLQYPSFNVVIGVPVVLGLLVSFSFLVDDAF